MGDGGQSVWATAGHATVKIDIATIKHPHQRYATWADWEFIGGPDNIRIRISDVGNWRYELLAAIHELLEATLCYHHGVSQERVDEYDFVYEQRRMAGEHRAQCGCIITDDPGSDVHSPYRAQHHYAESVEYGFAKLLGVDPKEYDAAFIALDGGAAGNRK